MRKRKKFHRENDLDAGISTSASTKIKFFCTCVYACAWAATSENEIPFRHNTSTRIFTTRCYVSPMKNKIQITSLLNSFSNLRKVRVMLRVLVFTSNFVFTWLLALVLASPVKTRLKPVLITCPALERVHSRYFELFKSRAKLSLTLRKHKNNSSLLI